MKLKAQKIKQRVPIFYYTLFFVFLPWIIFSCNHDSATGVKNRNPEIPTIIYPSGGEEISETSITLRWESVDQDEDDLEYFVTMDTVTPPTKVVGFQLEDDHLDVDDLERGFKYYWQVTVDDGTESVKSSVFNFSVQDTAGTLETDTILITDTLTVNDTLEITDTLETTDTITITDTLLITDTVTINDTINPYDTIPDNGNFLVDIEPSTLISDELTDHIGANINLLAALLDTVFKLPAGDIKIEYKDCSIINAYYSFSPPTINMCWDLLADMFRHFQFYVEPIIYPQLAFEWVFFHELGHALVDQLDLPALGNLETVADAIGTIFLVDLDQNYNGIGAVAGADYLSNNGDSPWYDTHQTGPQRLGNITCWAVGKNPELLNDPGVYALASVLYDSGRNCPVEAEQQDSSIEEIFKPYLQPWINVEKLPSLPLKNYK